MVVVVVVGVVVVAVVSRKQSHSAKRCQGGVQFCSHFQKRF